MGGGEGGRVGAVGVLPAVTGPLGVDPVDGDGVWVVKGVVGRVTTENMLGFKIH